MDDTEFLFTKRIRGRYDPVARIRLEHVIPKIMASCEAFSKSYATASNLESRGRVVHFPLRFMRIISDFGIIFLFCNHGYGTVSTLIRNCPRYGFSGAG